MIVDTSALVALVFDEVGGPELRKAIVRSKPVVPAPVLTELRLVASRGGPTSLAAAEALIDALIVGGVEFAPFNKRHADITALAREKYGKGNGKGGELNFGDLMVYAVAKERGAAVLCTGGDFASTDLEIHPASRFGQ